MENTQQNKIIPRNPGLRLDLHEQYLASERGQKRYSFSAIFTLPDPSTLPKHCMPTPLAITNQRDTDMCLWPIVLRRN
jgi:hypothetical protein